ncbi:MAG TPA: redoxin domain-containing protein [Ktedonobacterales bacterium]|nr:redoxin domain-containing protein [Ktedonobacterales bacterium]
MSTASLAATPTLKTGDDAPDFILKSGTGETITLSQYRGQKNVVLAFFPFAFSGTCSAQMPSYQAELERFQSYDTQVLGVSMDATHSLREFGQKLGISYPLLSDFYPQGKVTDAYGVRHAAGMPERALFVIDKSGKIAWIHVHRPTGEAPDNEELFEILRKLS